MNKLAYRYIIICLFYFYIFSMKFLLQPHDMHYFQVTAWSVVCYTLRILYTVDHAGKPYTGLIHVIYKYIMSSYRVFGMWICWWKLTWLAGGRSWWASSSAIAFRATVTPAPRGFAPGWCTIVHACWRGHWLSPWGLRFGMDIRHFSPSCTEAEVTSGTLQ